MYVFAFLFFAIPIGIVLTILFFFFKLIIREYFEDIEYRGLSSIAYIAFWLDVAFVTFIIFSIVLFIWKACNK